MLDSQNLKNLLSFILFKILPFYNWRIINKFYFRFGWCFKYFEVPRRRRLPPHLIHHSLHHHLTSAPTQLKQRPPVTSLHPHLPVFLWGRWVSRGSAPSYTSRFSEATWSFHPFTSGAARWQLRPLAKRSNPPSK